ncbi:MAG: hypothetical protein JKY60_06035, partial [Kordiimonadaceae bacterium]|nr:hypothetical protein [Kordiimonadaceae bacterium]
MAAAAATALALSASLNASPAVYYQYIVCEGETAGKGAIVVGQSTILLAKNKDKIMKAFELNLGVLYPKFVVSGRCQADGRTTRKASDRARYLALQNYAKTDVKVYRVPELSRSAGRPFGINLGARNYRITDGQPWVWETREVKGGDKPYPTKRYDVKRVQMPDGIFRNFSLFTTAETENVFRLVATRTLASSVDQSAFPERHFAELTQQYGYMSSVACEEHGIVGYHRFEAEDRTARAHGYLEGRDRYNVHLELSALYASTGTSIQLDYRLVGDTLLKYLKEGSQKLDEMRAHKE